MYADKVYNADSIVNNILRKSLAHSRCIDTYQSNIYVKELLNVRRKNFLFQYLPFMFRIKHNERKYIRELYLQLHYKAPNIYDQKSISSIGTVPHRYSLLDAMVERFHVNMYSTTLLYDKMFSPITLKGKRYYSYKLDSVMTVGEELQYKISFKPKNNSPQLIKGYMIVSDKVWTIREFYFVGTLDLLHFKSKLLMGKTGTPEEFLPIQCNIDGRYKLMGNDVQADYFATMNYHDIKKSVLIDKKEVIKSKYDLSDFYTLSTNTAVVSHKHKDFASIRPVGLNDEEKSIYAKYYKLKYNDGLLLNNKSKTKAFWGEVGDVLLDNYNINFANAGNLYCKSFFNPFLLSYSKTNGVSYSQSFKYNYLFIGDRLLRIVPRMGYNFTKNEFFWKINSEFNYLPRKKGAIHLDFGNGNRIYSSDILNDLKIMPDSLVNFDKIKLYYFHDNFLEAYNTVELLNGLDFRFGFSFHRRTPVDKDVPMQDVSEQIRSVYKSFATRVKFVWTPQTYYYYNGHRKINLNSKFPTFSVDYERGLKGVLGSSGKYERIEFDVQHAIPLGLIRTIYYHFGCGAFTDQQELYFVDFVNFTPNYLPEGWDDQISGSFQLLGAPWYNSSRKYLQGHVMYETPFLLAPHLMKNLRNIMTERLYVNALLVNHLTPYVELGYGIGTSFFSFGVFSSFNKGKYVETGCKFTFELFDK